MACPAGPARRDCVQRFATASLSPQGQLTADSLWIRRRPARSIDGPAPDFSCPRLLPPLRLLPRRLPPPPPCAPPCSRCCASWACGSTSSKSGSDPNCTTRVTNFAFGFACSAPRRVSRRVFQMSEPSKPNYRHGGEVRWLRYVVPLEGRAYPDERMNTKLWELCGQL